MSSPEKNPSLLAETWSDLNIRPNPNMYAGAILGAGLGVVAVKAMQPESTTEFTTSVDGNVAMHEVHPDSSISGAEGVLGGALIGAVVVASIASWAKRKAERTDSQTA